jgi:glycerol-3-phosphate acyltransferase PlsY
VVYGLVYAISRISSLGSLLGAVSFVPLLYFVSGRNRVLTAFAALILVAIIVTHRENIRRLVTRSEGKV